ncbi:hypothetical protein L484_025376 [Morus notabilis]|uniref:Uncharacterized protein n=1 Tax=Morus notabilis TaxID=981085 RepID=W9R2E4_9ROSA|nr:hypothetical protein L484_025376 [Morus notabilis]
MVVGRKERRAGELIDHKNRQCSSSAMVVGRKEIIAVKLFRGGDERISFLLSNGGDEEVSLSSKQSYILLRWQWEERREERASTTKTDSEALLRWWWEERRE